MRKCVGWDNIELDLLKNYYPEASFLPRRSLQRFFPNEHIRQYNAWLHLWAWKGFEGTSTPHQRLEPK